MTIIACPSCAGHIDSTAHGCPKCGRVFSFTDRNLNRSQARAIEKEMRRFLKSRRKAVSEYFLDLPVEEQLRWLTFWAIVIVGTVIVIALSWK